jgi:glyoxylase-like metal-dependent hydrolase (beta-lactamase superfamily II)
MSYTNQVNWLPNQGWDSRIHIAANGDLVNVFVVITQRYIIIVDTLLNATTAQALMDFAQPHLTGRQLLVINTHADWDHAWGNQLFAGANAPYPAPIIAHVACAARFDLPETRALLEQFQLEQPAIFGDVLLTKPTLTFTEELTIDGGDLTLHLFYTPGHTADHIAIYIPEISTLFAGDAAELPFPFADSPTTLPDLRASLALLDDVNANTVLYCHASPTIGPQLIRDNRAYFDALEAASRAALARGLDPAQIPNTELAAALGCDYAAVTPMGGAWDEVSPANRTEGHVEQLRMMLTWVAHNSPYRFSQDS